MSVTWVARVVGVLWVCNECAMGAECVQCMVRVCECVCVTCVMCVMSVTGVGCVVGVQWVCNGCAMGVQWVLSVCSAW